MCNKNKDIYFFNCFAKLKSFGGFKVNCVSLKELELCTFGILTKGFMIKGCFYRFLAFPSMSSTA